TSSAKTITGQLRHFGGSGQPRQKISKNRACLGKEIRSELLRPTNKGSTESTAIIKNYEENPTRSHSCGVRRRQHAADDGGGCKTCHGSGRPRPSLQRKGRL